MEPSETVRLLLTQAGAARVFQFHHPIHHTQYLLAEVLPINEPNAGGLEQPARVRQAMQTLHGQSPARCPEKTPLEV